MSQTASAEIDFFEKNKAEIITLLDGVAAANISAIERTQPRHNLATGALYVVKMTILDSFRNFFKLEKLTGVWSVVSLGIILLGLFFGGSNRWATVVSGFVFMVASPLFLFGWIYLPIHFFGAFRQGGQGSVRSAEPEIFVARSSESGAQRLIGFQISKEGVRQSFMKTEEGVTCDTIPNAYILLKIKKSTSHLLNTKDGKWMSYFLGIQFLANFHQTYGSYLATELGDRGLLSAIYQLKEAASTLHVSSASGNLPTFRTSTPTIETGIKASWDDLILNEGFKDELQSTVEMMKNAKTLKRQGFEPPSSLLLYGPPGTGKTQVARTLATMSGLSFIPCAASDLKGEYIGHSAPRVKEIFARARAASPSIIFIDEIESVASRRDGGQNEKDRLSDEIVSELLVQMDGVVKQEGEVFIVAATNFPDKIDAAVLSRFNMRKEIQLPDLEARKKMLRVFLDGKPVSEDLAPTLDELAINTEGLSGRDLRSIVDSASRKAVTRSLKTGSVHNIVIWREDFSNI